MPIISSSSPRRQAGTMPSSDFSPTAYRTPAERARLKSEKRAAKKGGDSNGLFSSLDQVIDVDALSDGDNADHAQSSVARGGSNHAGGTPADAKPRIRPSLSKPGEYRYTQKDKEAANSPAPRVGSSLLVGGSGARKPTQLLHRSGTSLRRAQLINDDSSDSESESAKKRQKAAITKVKTNGAEAANDVKASIPISSSSSDVKPVVPPAPMAAPSAPTLAAPLPAAPLAAPALPKPSAQPSDNICLGMIQATLLCLNGLPHAVTFTPTVEGHGIPALEDIDPIYDKALWPIQTSFWAEKGYRATVLELVPNSIHRQIFADEAARGNKDLPAAKRVAQEIKVSVVVPPALQRNTSAEDQARGIIEKEAPFAVLAAKYCDVLDGLLRTGQLRLESRVPLAANNKPHYTHRIEMLAFTQRQHKEIISIRLLQGGIHLDNPDGYTPRDYPGHPNLENPHSNLHMPNLTDPLGKTSASRGAGNLFGPAGGLGAPNEQNMSEEEKKAQVNSVYASLTHAEDVSEVVPSPLLKTNLFPHQRKALGFLLMREKERNFDDVMRKSLAKEDRIKKYRKEMLQKEKDKEARKAKGEPEPEEVGQADPEGTPAGGKDLDAEDRAEEDGGTVSLWKPIKNTVGGIKAYFNVVTRQTVRERPEICRGAILADDMGLGKTISVIALLAHTRDESIAFSRTLPAGKKGIATTLSSFGASTRAPLMLSDSDSEPEYGGMASARGKGKAKAKGKATASSSAPASKKLKDAAGFSTNVSPSKLTRKERAKEQEEIRKAHLEVRSRATLIVCPMSIIGNWEEQIKEHWGHLHRPKIYIYHGPQRSKDLRFIANHDVVLTTYSTLGSEFSNQTIWQDYTIKTSDKTSDKEDDGEDLDMSSESDFEQPTHDAEGKAIHYPRKPKTKRKKPSKKVLSKTGDSPNLLQRIEWFRIVLDEAHIVKEPKTWQSKAVCNLSAQRRTALTGTPVQNRVDDLYALIRFLRLDPFSDRVNWNYWCNTSANLYTLKNARHSNKPLDSVSLARVQTIMKFLTMRRTKDTTGPDGKPILDLPPKYQRTVMLKFGEVEKAKYDAMHQMYKEDFEDMMRANTVQQNYATILTEILNLRMSCDHPELVDQGKDLRRQKGGKGNVVIAIEEDGITRDRAVALFRLLRSNGTNECNVCAREVTMGLDDAGPREDDIYGGSKGRGKSKAGAGDGSEPELLRPVITKCQHMCCSECFLQYVPYGTGWPRPRADAKAAMCPECNLPISLTLEVVQLERTDFEELDIDGSDVESIPDRYDWDDDDDDGPPGSKRDKKLAIEAAKLRQGDLNDSLRARPDLSTKIHALTTDLLQFSFCNPASKLFDPAAPKLDHMALSPEQIELEQRAAQAGVTLKQDHGAVGTASLQGAGSVNLVRPALPDKSASTMTKDGQVKAGDAASADAPPVETVRVVEWHPSVNTDGSITTYKPIKSIVFSQWTRMLNRVEKCIRRTGIKCVRLDGSMSREERLEALEAFKSIDSCEVMLISLRAGGFGLNLVSAARAYLIDPYWNPAVEMQGLDRIHRLGQTRPVITTKLIMSHSIEENLLELQAKKMQLAETVGSRRQISADQRRNERRQELSILFRTR